ncbi:MAG: M20/M25/M40 family metallo-hydrolase [Gemmatimonadaceae bacterium]|nr:M20/M25/M40 family metallo-hydrolase [Gemmatimonadaceae bacterium]
MTKRAALTRLSLAAFAIALHAPTISRAQTLPERYRATTDRIIAAALSDSAAYNRVALLTDKFGHRLSGSTSLEHALDWIIAEMTRDGLQNVRGEPVMVPRWVRGEESATMVRPRPMKLHMLGLGGSIGTPEGGITASVLVVTSFDDLADKADQARGKIVLFDAPFTNYGATVQYRSRGAIEAAKVGAVAALIRSVASNSMQNPHTGAMRYDSTVTQIPAAALSVEDAAMLHRMYDRGDPVVVNLRMEAKTWPDARSRNVIAELVGSEKPEEIVVLGGHIDSWDVGQGAMDDAGGSVAAWEAVRLLKQLGLRPRRTLRVVLWTNEENGLRGANAYRDAHAAEMSNHVLAMESDGGVFAPKGFSFDGSSEALPAVAAIASLLQPLGANEVAPGGAGADVGPLTALGVPGLGLQVDGTRYFWYHHSEADTMDKLDPREVAQCVAAMAVMAYVIADMPETLPRRAPR